MGSIMWDREVAEVYDQTYRAKFEPSVLDLMAKIAGLRLRDRWEGWDRAPFTSDSPSQVAVFEKNA
ncbi:MAG TPA: hypothetical protein VG123_18410 [Streptosporangiaceae bacterium]|jgi:hypothetical protein|nr:hypothetical protein [Streptosporangiaceae bacterium]